MMFKELGYLYIIEETFLFQKVWHINYIYKSNDYQLYVFRMTFFCVFILARKYHAFTAVQLLDIKIQKMVLFLHGTQQKKTFHFSKTMLIICAWEYILIFF